MTITLNLSPGGAFSWALTEEGRTQTIQGQAGYQDQVLILGQQQGPPLTGRIAMEASNTAFTFKPPGAPEASVGLAFTRQPS